MMNYNYALRCKQRVANRPAGRCVACSGVAAATAVLLAFVKARSHTPSKASISYDFSRILQRDCPEFFPPQNILSIAVIIS